MMFCPQKDGSEHKRGEERDMAFRRRHSGEGGRKTGGTDTKSSGRPGGSRTKKGGRDISDRDNMQLDDD